MDSKKGGCPRYTWSVDQWEDPDMRERYAMVAERKVVDVETVPELAPLTDEVAATRQPIVLRKQGKDLAKIIPIEGLSPYSPGRRKTPEDRQAFLASAGGWQGVVDETSMEEIYGSRSVSSRSLVDL